jgi:hypothetical protein
MVADLIREYWSLIRQNPLPFVLTFLAGLAVGIPAIWFLAHWRYDTLREAESHRQASATSSQRDRFEGEVAASTQRIEALKERMQVKDEQLSEYRERLKIESATATKYSQMSNKELIESTYKFISEFRALGVEAEQQDRKLMEQSMRGMDFNAFVSASRTLHATVQQSYDQRFRATAILLRDELRSRLPKNFASTTDESQRSMLELYYDRPSSQWGIPAIALDLEKMAGSLPHGQGK